MKIKHKLLTDYQHLSNDKKIFMIKSGTILNNYTYLIGMEEIVIDKDIINGNPNIFSPVDWKQELHSYIKVNKFPQPKTLASKMEPFIEEMIISSMGSGDITHVDDEKYREIERRERDLNNRESRISDKEEEIEIRLNRVGKREESYKEDLKSLDKKEDELRERSRVLTEKQLDLEDKIQDLNEKERNFDRSILESAKDLDVKYIDLQNKIDRDLKIVTEKEKDLEVLTKEIKRKEDRLTQRESEIDDKIRDFDIKYDQFKNWENELRKLDKEIKDWENMHWKFKRSVKPPSVE
jgi:hypothetical protein